MSSLLNAVNVSSDGFIIGELPVNHNDVSIVTMEELYQAVRKIKSVVTSYTLGNWATDYFVYSIVGDNGKESTLANLQMVGINWYKQKNQDFGEDVFFALDNVNMFGGRIGLVHRDIDDGTYSFIWYHTAWDCTSGNSVSSDGKDYWACKVPGDVFVAVVHK